MEEQLANAIQKYFRGLIDSHDFKLIREDAYGMGAFKEYENGVLFIQIVNDKGIISLDVAPSTKPEKARDIALYKELLEPPAHGFWNLSLKEQADFLEDNWEWFVTNLSADNTKKTLGLLDDCARKRAKKVFG